MEPEIGTQSTKMLRKPPGKAKTPVAGAVAEPNYPFPGPETVELPGSEQYRSRQRFYQRLALGLLTLLCMAGLFALLRVWSPTLVADMDPPVKFTPPPSFQGWEKPAVAIVISGQQHGYLQPCGCSKPQYGGLTRRYNFVQSLKQKGWPVVAVDLGDVAANKLNPQLNLKYSTSMKALQAIGYFGVGIGATELSMPLEEAIAEHRLNNPMPKMLSSTLLDPKTNQFIKMHVDGASVTQAGPSPKVGVFSLTSPDITNKINGQNNLAFRDNASAINQELEKLKQEKAQIAVLLYQGDNKQAELVAKYCADLKKKDPTLPTLDVILCLSAEEEPPSVPAQIKDAPTWIINIGHKGRYVGVIGAFPTGRLNPPYQFKYQLVSIGPQYDTPEEQVKGHPIMGMMEDYAKEVKAGNYITKFPTAPHPVQIAFADSKYVGSQRCQSCHPQAYDIWEKSGHAHAFSTLEKVPHPPLRNFDAECVVCHVVGFKYSTGYADALRTDNQKMIPKLKDVGCESCHGPASEHVKSPRDKDIHAVINPWKAGVAGLNMPPAQKQKLLMTNIDKFCQSCHDIDNDVHWNFEKKWPLIVHKEPPKNPAQPAANPVAPQENGNVPALVPIEQPQTAPPQANPPQPEPESGGFKLFKKFRKNK